MQKSHSWGSRSFDIFNHLLMLVLIMVCLLPFVHVLAASFATPAEILTRPFLLYPRQITGSAYAYIFSANTMLRSLGVSVFLTVVGTLSNMVMTTLMAYPLSRSQLMGRRFLMRGIVFTMMFSGGMIPSFLVVRLFGLLDSLGSLIFPGAISAFNLIIMRNFFQQIPLELEESAKIDGYNDLQIYWRIMLPLSMASLATLTLFYAVGHWNSYFSAILYINDPKKYPVQVVLRQVIALSNSSVGDSSSMDENYVIPTATVKMATIVVTIAPIMVAYPFLQKYFVKGALLGSIKG